MKITIKKSIKIKQDIILDTESELVVSRIPGSDNDKARVVWHSDGCGGDIDTIHLQNSLDGCREYDDLQRRWSICGIGISTLQIVD